jgi:hypothetical protein
MISGAAALLIATSMPAMASDLVVIDSSAPQYRPGQVLDAAKPVSLAPGAKISVVGQDGRVIKLQGPFSGAPGAGSGKGDPGVVQTLSKLLSGGKAETAALGTFRGSEGSTAGAAGDIWAVDVMASETYCTASGRAPTLWRPDAVRESTVALEKGDTAALVRFPAGSDAAAWPVQVPVENAARYVIRDANDTWSTRFTLVVVPADAGEGASQAAWMAEHGCARQARALIAGL